MNKALSPGLKLPLDLTGNNIAQPLYSERSKPTLRKNDPQ